MRVPIALAVICLAAHVTAAAARGGASPTARAATKPREASLARVVQGAWGKKPGQFGLGAEGAKGGPCSFAVSEHGWIYVLDQQNFRFQIFDASGRLMKVCSFKGPGLLDLFCVAPNGTILASSGPYSIARSSGCALKDMRSGDMQFTSISRMAASECESLYLEESGGSEDPLIRRYSINADSWMRYERTFFGTGLVRIPFSCDIAFVKEVKRSGDEVTLAVDRVGSDGRREPIPLVVPVPDQPVQAAAGCSRTTRLMGAAADGSLYVLDKVGCPRQERGPVRVLRYSRTGELEDVLVLKDPQWQHCELGPDRVQVGQLGAIYVAEADDSGYRISKVRQ